MSIQTDGFGTLFAEASGSSVPITTPYDLYISGTGSDANDGLSPTSPVLTWGKVWQLVNMVQQPIARAVVVHIADGSYTFSNPPGFDLASNTYVYLCGDGGGQVGMDGFTEVRPPELYSAYSNALQDTNLTFSGSSPLADAYQCLTLEVTSGTGAGQRKLITKNTATQVWTAGQFSTPLDNTSQFRVVQPAVILDLDNSTVVLSSNIVLVNLRFQSGTLTLSKNICAAFGVEISGSASATECNIAVLTSTELYCGSANALNQLGNILSPLGISDNWHWNGWGLTASQADEFNLDNQGTVNGFLGRPYIYSYGNSETLMYGGIFYAMDLDGPSYAWVQGWSPAGTGHLTSTNYGDGYEYLGAYGNTTAQVGGAYNTQITFDRVGYYTSGQAEVTVANIQATLGTTAEMFTFQTGGQISIYNCNVTKTVSTGTLFVSRPYDGNPSLTFVGYPNGNTFTCTGSNSMFNWGNFMYGSRITFYSTTTPSGNHTFTTGAGGSMGSFCNTEVCNFGNVTISTGSWVVDSSTWRQDNATASLKVLNLTLTGALNLKNGSYMQIADGSTSPKSLGSLTIQTGSRLTIDRSTTASTYSFGNTTVSEGSSFELTGSSGATSAASIGTFSVTGSKVLFQGANVTCGAITLSNGSRLDNPTGTLSATTLALTEGSTVSSSSSMSLTAGSGTGLNVQEGSSVSLTGLSMATSAISVTSSNFYCNGAVSCTTITTNRSKFDLSGGAADLNSNALNISNGSQAFFSNAPVNVTNMTFSGSSTIRFATAFSISGTATLTDNCNMSVAGLTCTGALSSTSCVISATGAISASSVSLTASNLFSTNTVTASSTTVQVDSLSELRCTTLTSTTSTTVSGKSELSCSALACTSFTCSGNSAAHCSGTITATASSGTAVSIASMSSLHANSVAANTAGISTGILVQKGSRISLAGANVSASGGHGLKVEGSVASITNPTSLKSTLAGSYAVYVQGGQVYFDGTYTAANITGGTASSDLKVGASAAVASTTLSTSNSFITDADTTAALGGGSVIWRN